MKNLARSILSDNVKTKIRGVLSRFDLGLSRRFAHPSLKQRAPWFYHWFNGQFSREQVAVLAGKNAYYQQQGIGDKSSALLRRNTHRLEKGLSMSPRRPVFAAEYIGETVECFGRCLQSEQVCLQELSWAFEVLSEYFNTVDDTPVIATAKGLFSSFEPLVAAKIDPQLMLQFQGFTARTPYEQQQIVQSGVGAEQFNALCQQRRSVRWFTSQAVPDELLNQAIATASLAPSACNRQPFQFYVANGNDMATKVAKLAGGTVGFVDNIPCTLVVVGDLSAYALERDRHVIYLDGALASMQLMLALETLGLSSCPINWPDIEVPERKMAKLLKLEAHQRPVMLLAIGYPKETGMIPYSQKKSVEVLRKDI